MIERTVNVGIDKAYSDLKAVLLEKGCKIISEERQKQILVKQGSIWGMSPRTSKKIVEVNFAQVDSGTQVNNFSRLSSDWKNLTVIGCALAAVLVGLCLWITVDLDAFLVTQKPGFWSWLVTVNWQRGFSSRASFCESNKGSCRLPFSYYRFRNCDCRLRAYGNRQVCRRNLQFTGEPRTNWECT